VYVDYAHTPAGVEASVQHLLAKHGELVVVLGASGNRDQGKRSEMAKACRGVTKLFVTDQHPRDEDPALIRQQLLRGAEEAEVDATEVQD
ncbi:MAG: cyanophycin synthetase, partial [Aquiluna sp.]